MSVNGIKLEVCVDSIASAIAAAEGGAARIELCSALNEGGLTPTVGTLKCLKSLPLNIPIFCMLRPRCGNDFIYSSLELDSLLTDLESLRDNGADGFVFGALTELCSIDIDKCQQIIKQAGECPVTFHRAFDLTDPSKMHENVALIKEMGFKRLLSSGFRQTAQEGIHNLSQLIKEHHRNFIVMPGAGINISNLYELLIVSKCREFHSSAKSTVTPTAENNDIFLGKQDLSGYTIASANIVRKMVSTAQKITSNN